MCLAIPGQITTLQPSTEGPGKKATVSFGGILREVSLDLLPEARPGDYVLVHVGVAISLVDPAEAAEIFRYLQASGEEEWKELNRT